ncbi:NTF2- export protein 2 [Coemansia sp. RSA 1939]|nr:NTF2- export protein 2 [Coemansia sp. RSA 1939]KAJ2617627.1 NTF2- export protein 2 [Coemansia sp. RSA 1804]KAJ2695476.1 NTF2- export protein 2 [Coemansia sp. RSA 1285]
MEAQADSRAVAQALNTAERFVENYYRSFSKTVGKFYQDDTKVLWNGNGFGGAQFKAQVLPQLQQALAGGFEVHGLDTQPLGDFTLATVTGLVRIGGKKNQFTQTFVVQRTGGLTYIVSDAFRLV